MVPALHICLPQFPADRTVSVDRTAAAAVVDHIVAVAAAGHTAVVDRTVVAGRTVGLPGCRHRFELARKRGSCLHEAVPQILQHRSIQKPGPRRAGTGWKNKIVCKY